MKSLSSAGLAVAVLLAQAAAGRAQEKPEETPYYPFKVGTTWEYKVGDNKCRMRVTRHEKVEAVMCARVELVTLDKTQEKVLSWELVGLTKEGLCRFSYEDKKAQPPVCFLKLPPKKDETWKVDAKVGGETVRGTFKEGEEEVKVPAGTYKTVTATAQDLDANGIKMNITYYFARDVGMVKQVVEVAGQKVVIELEKFEPGK